ncbi:MAG: hypothetical protein ABI053_07380 [Lacisediminihabitans sp.]
MGIRGEIAKSGAGEPETMGFRHDSEPDICALATAAALRSLFAAALPIPITLVAITTSPFLPYSIGALVAFALVATCVTLAIYYGCRVLGITKQAVPSVPIDAGRRSAASISVSANAGHALARRRRMGVVGIVLGCLHGVFLIGSAAVSIPGMIWLASVSS